MPIVNFFNIRNRRTVFLVICLLVFPVLLTLANESRPRAVSSHKVMIAFGFHVNLYHSFRNDTNDDSGFGKDIRIIRQTIKTLDRYNARGVPVRGIWDFDNLFSLQEILPQYAPDIIADIQRRVRENGDEVILMSYNNGLVSAMTDQEFNDAVRWSVTNPWGSGVKDIFGQYTPIVRPQEMMTTPGNFSIYKKHGVQAVALYYSATPFDAFRVFSRPLSRTEAHNPMFYKNPQTQEEMVIIPTYHMGDLTEHVSLKHWVKELHDLQNRGKLNSDALIYINFDADSELWSGVDLPWGFGWVPNTGGLDELISQVRRLPCVAFTTLKDYLAGHPPVGSFSFSQDTADGSFNGYNSWAEKAEASRYWTTIQRNRRVCNAARRAAAILENAVDGDALELLLSFAERRRLRALSTTNFGMATPFLVSQREEVMADLTADLDRYSDQIEHVLAEGLRRYSAKHPAALNVMDGRRILDTLLVLRSGPETDGDGNRLLKVKLPEGYQKGMRLDLVRPDGSCISALRLDRQVDSRGKGQLVFYLEEHSDVSDGVYHLCAVTEPPLNPVESQAGLVAAPNGISNGRLSVRFKERRVEGVYLDGVRQVEAGSFMPYLKWGDKIFRAEGRITGQSVGKDGKSVSFHMAGILPGPNGHSLSDGWMDYRITLLEGQPYLLLEGNLRYPATEKQSIFKPSIPGLVRRFDANWQDVAPAEIKFSPQSGAAHPIRVHKQNYLGVATQYPLDYYRHSDRNRNLDNINNHITQAYIGLTAGDNGMAIAMDGSVSSNFAFAPLRLRYHRKPGGFSIRANPFGTYQGDQYVPPTWGNGNGFDATLIAGEQFAGAGPTYNGKSQRFHLLIAFFNKRELPEKIQRDLTAFAFPAVVISSNESAFEVTADRFLPTPQGLVAVYKNDVVRFNWDNDRYPQAHYRIFCGSGPGQYEAVYPAVGNRLDVSRFAAGVSFEAGEEYYAVITRVSGNGRTSARSPEIRFTINEPVEPHPKVPLGLGLKVLWANLGAFLASM